MCGDKIIFLDIDGVINLPKKTSRGINASTKIDASCCQNLKKVLDASGAFIVITSTWRLQSSVMDGLKEQLRDFGIYSFRIVGQTSNLTKQIDFSTYAELRWLEIKDYIRQKNIKDYIIIDDVDLSKYEKQRFVKTDIQTGLTSSLAAECIKKLKGNA
jgi:hypothetical protein